MNFKKSIKTLGIAALLIVILSVPVSAVDFTNALVDSNTWTTVKSASKDGTANPYVKVTAIYKADGSASNYQYVRVNILSNGYQASTSTNTKISKGTIVEIPIATAYKVKGKNITLMGMGNNSSLDCRITGVFSPN